MDIIELARQNATIEGLDERYRELAELTGLEGFFRLCEYAGGDNFYVPTLKQVLKPYIYKYVVKKVQETDGVISKSKIARVCGLSTTTVYRLFNEADGKAEKQPCTGESRTLT